MMMAEILVARAVKIFDVDEYCVVSDVRNEVSILPNRRAIINRILWDKFMQLHWGTRVKNSGEKLIRRINGSSTYQFLAELAHDRDLIGEPRSSWGYVLISRYMSLTWRAIAKFVSIPAESHMCIPSFNRQQPWSSVLYCSSLRILATCQPKPGIPG